MSRSLAPLLSSPFHLSFIPNPPYCTSLHFLVHLRHLTPSVPLHLQALSFCRSHSLIGFVTTTSNPQIPMTQYFSLLQICLSLSHTDNNNIFKCHALDYNRRGMEQCQVSLSFPLCLSLCATMRGGRWHTDPNGVVWICTTSHSNHTDKLETMSSG